jgi:AraC-like DNA-binding protein
MSTFYGATAACTWRFLARFFAKNEQAEARRASYPSMMSGSVELLVSMPGLRAARWRTESLYAGMKTQYAVGRVEQGRTEWWGGGKVWRSAPGSILVKQPGDVHRDLSRDGPTTWTVVTLPAEDIARMGGKGVAIAQLEANDERAAPFHRLHDAVCAGADRLTLEVAVAEAVSTFGVLSRANPDRTRPVRRAMEYLRERLADSITLEDLAAHAGLDKFHLCRAFRAQIGMPPHAYLTHLRIMRAKELLMSGVRASEVAPLVGLYDQAQLTRHFRRIVGTTPARYRVLTASSEQSSSIR